MAPEMSPPFREALRAELVRRVESTPARPHRSRRWRWTTGAMIGVLLAGGATWATADRLLQPGMPDISTVGEEVGVSAAGTRAIDLGPRPDAATSVWFDLVCLTPGTFELGVGGASMTCGADDAGGEGGHSWGTLPLSSLQGDTFVLTAAADAEWKLTLAYVDEEPTGWAVNGVGETLGVQNENGTPDLIAVIATNGREGYARRDDLEEADGTAAARDFESPEDALEWQAERAGKTFAIPVYEADGTTVIGEFVVAG